MTAGEMAATVSASVAVASFVLAAGAFYFKHRESLEITITSFMPAKNDLLIVGGSEAEGRPAEQYEISLRSAELSVKLKNTGAKPLAIEKVMLNDADSNRGFGSFQYYGEDPRLEEGATRTVQVPVGSDDGLPLLKPPAGRGIIEVTTPNKIFRSKPFVFSHYSTSRRKEGNS